MAQVSSILFIEFDTDLLNLPGQIFGDQFGGVVREASVAEKLFRHFQAHEL